MEERSFIEVLLTALKKLVIKMVSLKNIIGIGSIVLGVVVISMGHINSTFKEWGDYTIKVLVIFYASNQIQKWIFAKKGYRDDREDVIYDKQADTDDDIDLHDQEEDD